MTWLWTLLIVIGIAMIVVAVWPGAGGDKHKKTADEHKRIADEHKGIGGEHKRTADEYEKAGGEHKTEGV